MGDQDQGTQTKRTFCRVCEPACGLIATVENDRLIKLAPDKAHPISKGFVCNKGIYGLDIHNDPDRLNQPMKKNDEGEFEPISWTQALTEISAKLKQICTQHGSSAIASYTGNPTAFNALFAPSFGNFMRQLKAGKHFSSGTQDCANKFAASEAVFGTRTLHPVPDFDRSDFIVLIGENPAVSHMSFVSVPNPMQHLKDAVARNARVVHVNPRQTESAHIAGEVLLVNPDTDVYLLAAMLHVIARTPGFHAATPQAHADNLPELENFVKDYSPATVAPVVGLTSQEIEQFAQDFAAADNACVHMSTGVNMGRQGTLAYWLLQMLSLVTGNLGKPGGNFFSEGFYARSTAAGRRAPLGNLDTPYGPVRKPGGVGISLPGTLMAEYLASSDEPIRGLFVNSGNPILSVAGEEQLRSAFSELELVVCVDIYRNATGELADYLLPAASAFEREDVNLTGLGLQYRPSIQFTEAVVPPAAERKPEWWIFEKLSQAMGFDNAYDAFQDQEEQPNMWQRIDAMLKSRGQDMASLRQQTIITFDTAKPADLYTKYIQHEGGVVDCFPAAFTDAIDSLAVQFKELQQAPEHQLKLITKRDSYMFNSWYSNLEKLKRHGREQNRLYMHPQDAERRQIANESQVEISNQNGSVVTEVVYAEDLKPGVVALSHGWGHQRAKGLKVASELHGVNANLLLPSGPGSFDPLSNQAHMTGVPVDVYPAKLAQVPR